jgi:hypothetical protein
MDYMQGVFPEKRLQEKVVLEKQGCDEHVLASFKEE